MHPLADIAAQLNTIPGPPIATPAWQPAGTGMPHASGDAWRAPAFGCHGSGDLPW